MQVEQHMDEPGLLSSGQVAAFLGVSVRTLQYLIADGVLPVYRVGGRRILRFMPSDVEALLQKSEPAK